jgi:hypothetical protein
VSSVAATIGIRHQAAGRHRPNPHLAVRVGGSIPAGRSGSILPSAEAQEAKSREELQAVIGIGHRQHFLLKYLRPLLEAGWLERTIPDKPRSRDQRYRITVLGLKVLKKAKKK